MGKSKNNKRKKRFKQKVEIVKSVKCQDKKEVQETEQVYSSDEEQRRATRLGAIIAIIVVVGTICMTIFRLCLGMLNLWTVYGIIYHCLQIVIFAIFSIVAILFYRLVTFIICDLMRYNVSDEKHRKFDKESDESYNLLIEDSKLYMVLLIVMFMVMLAIMSFCGPDKDIVAGSFLVGSMIFVGICALYHCKKKQKKISLNIRKGVSRVGVLIFVGIISFFVVLVFLTNDKSIAEITFNNNGNIEICNTSTKEIDNIEITIFDDKGNNILHEYISSENMLYAIERVDMYEEEDGVKITEIMIVNTELQHWKYHFDLNDVLADEGNYSIFIQITEGRNRVKMENEFTKDKCGYYYAINNIVKKY